MADTELSMEIEGRLLEHANYFDGLLSLIPAKLYFSEDKSDQWQRKKQTKEQAKAAKRAKLDPKNAKSAKDVLDEMAQKRKREEDEHAVAAESNSEQPAAKKAKKEKLAKKQRPAVDETVKGASPNDEVNIPTLQKVKAEKEESKKARKKARNLLKERTKQKTEQRKNDVGKSKESHLTPNEPEFSEPAGSKEVEGQFHGLETLVAEKVDEPTAAAESIASSRSPVFDGPTIQSGTSSISSFPDPAAAPLEKAPKESTEPKPSPEELKLRLQKRLEELRTARKADKEDNAPARTRQELIEERRKKDEERKVRRKALRKQQMEEERLKKEEEMSRGSPLMSPALRSPAGRHGLLPSPDRPNSFSFGRVAFDNGQTMTADLEKVLDAHTKKATKNPKRALEMAQQHEEKLAALDPEKRANISEKDMWLSARKRAHGERVKDDTSLLKKALKRKEKQKKKSVKAWDSRIEGVKKGQEARQQRREDNIQKRKEDKGSKGAKKTGKKSKAKARPGFEGSFRAGGKKK